jgi:hypothetical protein
MVKADLESLDKQMKEQMDILDKMLEDKTAELMKV